MGKSRGKVAGKIVFTVAGFFLGGALTMFGASSWLGNAVLGASLFGTVWNTGYGIYAARKNKNNESTSRFDRAMNTMTSNSPIFVVYGERLVQGNQTMHKPNINDKTLKKHVVICEGGIEGVISVMANGYPVRDSYGSIIATEHRVEMTEEQIRASEYSSRFGRSLPNFKYNGRNGVVGIYGDPNFGTVFLLTNTKWEDAHVSVDDRHDILTLSHNGGEFKRIKLGSTEHYDNADYEEYENDIGELIKWINSLGEGWYAIPYSQTSRDPRELRAVEYDCYNKCVPMLVECIDGVFTYHDGDVPDTYETTGSYAGCAWLDLWFRASDELSGNPNIDTIVLGRKVYDTRLQEWVFSTNPAMCLRDFILNDRFGIGWKGELDEDSFIEAANWCDEEIEYIDAHGVIQKRRRYELNIIIDAQEDAEIHVGNILAACQGYLVRYRGVIAMRIEKATPVSYHFTEKSIVTDSFTISQLGLDETPNRYNIKFIDPMNNWVSTKCIVEDVGQQESLGYVLEKDIELDGVTSQQQALRLGRFYRDLNAVCTKVVTFSTGAQAMHLQPGDVISVSYYDAISDVTFRITSIKEENNGVFSIEAREYNESIYNDSLGAQIQLRQYSHIDSDLFSHLRPPRITNVEAFTNGGAEIMAEHDPSEENDFDHYRYYIQEI